MKTKIVIVVLTVAVLTAFAIWNVFTWPSNNSVDDLDMDEIKDINSDGRIDVLDIILEVNGG